MYTYQFENRYGGHTEFQFQDNSMIIHVTGKRDYHTQYRFCYNAISTYLFSTRSHGYHELHFMSNRKAIEKTENGKVKLVSSCFVAVKAEILNSVRSHGLNQVVFRDSDEDIRKIILHRTPLRSENDLYIERQQAILAQFRATPETQFSQITIKGIKNIEASRLYSSGDYLQILLNNIPILTLHSNSGKHELMNAGMYADSHPANPLWLDNSTLSFQIPYGEWDLRYNIHLNRSATDRLPSDQGSKNIHLSLSPENKIINLKVKTGLFSTKLIII